MRRRAAKSREESMAGIIDATAQLVARDGFWGLRLRDVAQAEGITEAGVLYHFGSKEKLVRAVLDYRDKVDRKALYEQLGVPLPPEDAPIGEDDEFNVGLRDLTDATVRRNVNQPEIVRLYTVLQAEALAPDHPAHTYFADREQWVMREYTRAAANDGAADPLRTARHALAAMDGLQIRWLHDLTHIDLVQEWEFLADHLLKS